MRTTLFYLFVISVVISSCNHKDIVPVAPPVPPDTYDSSYIVDSLTDMVIGNISSRKIMLTVSLATGDTQTTIFATGPLPHNAEINYVYGFDDPTVSTTRHTPFKTQMILETHNVQPGVYPVKLLAISEGVKVEFNFKLDIRDSTLCSDYFYKKHKPLVIIPAYTQHDYIGAKVHYDTIKGDMYFDKLILRYTPSEFISNDSVRFNINCTTDSINMPLQNVTGTNLSLQQDSFTVKGSGYFYWPNRFFEFRYYTISSLGDTSKFILYGGMD